MLDDFLARAVLGAVGVALAAAPLGVFVVWRRMAYFGDATAHAAILGVALALAFELPIFAGTLAVAVVVAFMVAKLTGRGFGADMILGVASHSALAIGLVAVAFAQGPRLDLQAYLFGDILAVGKADLAVIWGGAAAVFALIAWRWRALLMATVSEDLAWASGGNPDREGRILMLALAIVVAVAIKVVGALLIGALLIIPAAAARPFARTPEQMVLGAMGLGCLASLGGLWGAWEWDTPAGPSIVCAAAILFALSLIAKGGRGA
ncbi:metal ABC transporter permease [Tropicibacter naphthalenivorans]|uniref:High-affinity zinc uptake system membrane protein ZnuB n=1 Tax=Tropicibacter naphthalenivorans TaxID=441103 RepID=A0A0P1G206_9RHOB|nr:metal ABC transporter permease [Tropicibacter naphthalenivorans]CUH75837.1 High-affinity zinc uptake system membrane protein ZnuB [Tropicibacter naphthalenivorans]SMC41914.1 zinc transport system permease protein [Tropicibacter naphthalenivorans]